MSEQIEEEARREWVKRRRTIEGWVNLMASTVAVLGGIAVAIGWFLDAVPFVKAQTYTVDHTRTEIRLGNVEGQVQSLTGDMATVKRNGTLTLQLQLRQRADLLTSTIANTSRASPAYFGLQQDLNATQQELDELTRQLNR